MFSCVIIDDDLFASAHLKRLISQRANLHLSNSFLKATNAIDYLSSNPTDIVFLDIYMPEMMGTVVAKLLHAKTMVIFTTTSKQHALEAFDINAVDYLLKPVNLDRFNMAVDKAQSLLTQKRLAQVTSAQQESRKIITIISDRKIYKIATQDIYYVESLYEYVCYYTTKGKLLSLAALKDVAEILPQDEFTRIHKSYIINIHHLSNYSAQNLKLNNGIELPIGRVYKQNFKESSNKI